MSWKVLVCKPMDTFHPQSFSAAHLGILHAKNWHFPKQLIDPRFKMLDLKHCVLKSAPAIAFPWLRRCIFDQCEPLPGFVVEDLVRSYNEDCQIAFACLADTPPCATSPPPPLAPSISTSAPSINAQASTPTLAPQEVETRRFLNCYMQLLLVGWLDHCSGYFVVHIL